MQVELRKLNTGSSIHMPNVHLLMCSGLLLGYHLHNSWHYCYFFCLERMIVWISLVYYKNTRLPSRFVLWSTLSEEVYSSSDFVHWTASIWSTVNNLRGSFNTSPSATNYTLVKKQQQQTNTFCSESVNRWYLFMSHRHVNYYFWRTWSLLRQSFSKINDWDWVKTFKVTMQAFWSLMD